MSLTSLLTQTVTIGRRSVTGEDPYGEPIVIYTDEIVLARFEWVSGVEIKSGQDTLLASAQAFLPPWVAINRKDRITYGGRVLQVEFVDEEWGQTSLHHRRVLLVEVK